MDEVGIDLWLLHSLTFLVEQHLVEINCLKLRLLIFLLVFSQHVFEIHYKILHSWLPCVCLREILGKMYKIMKIF